MRSQLLLKSILIISVLVSGRAYSENYEFSLLPPAIWAGSTLKGRACHGGINPYYGPYNYINPDHFNKKLEVVEVFHFTPKVETLAGGESSVTPAGDIYYTLLSFPNHHRALYSLIQMKARGHDQWMAEAKLPPVECFFQRAMEFESEDHVVPLLFGVYLQQVGYPEKALNYFKHSAKLGPNDPEPHYNIALYYFKKKKYKQSAEYAKKAYELNYPLPNLKRKLSKLGYM